MGGALGTVLSLFLPWVRSGHADRSGFELARTVDTLGLARSLPLRSLLVAVWLTPLLAALCWTAAALHRPKSVATMAAATALVAGAGAVVVFSHRSLHERMGPWIAIVAGVTALVGSLWLATTTRERHG